jgi:hypothetical protein
MNIITFILLWVLFTSVFVLLLDNLFDFRCSLEFIWYDLWIGVYIDRKKKIVYVNPLPCVVWKCEYYG